MLDCKTWPRSPISLWPRSPWWNTRLAARRDRGLSLHEALLDACHKRARPIMMTTVAMIAGMLPIALGLGSDASFRQPMAIAVIGGFVVVKFFRTQR